jgi:hypothetical protein
MHPCYHNNTVTLLVAPYVGVLVWCVSVVCWTSLYSLEGGGDGKTLIVFLTTNGKLLVACAQNSWLRWQAPPQEVSDSAVSLKCACGMQDLSEEEKG